MAYFINGKVFDEAGNPCQRTVILLDKNMNKIAQTTSNFITGEYEFRTPDNGLYNVSVIPADSDNDNIKIHSSIIPKEKPFNFESSAGIGTPGQISFGVGVCPNPPTFMEGLPGFDNPTSPNYGNYRHVMDGSIMVFIPAFWYKFGTGDNGLAPNIVDIKKHSYYANDATAAAEGYVIHRAFIDGGEVKTGFFIDKYKNWYNEELDVYSSLPEKIIDVWSQNSKFQNRIGQKYNLWNYYDDNIFYRCMFETRLRGSQFSPMTSYMYSALMMIAMCQEQNSTKETCPYKDDELFGPATYTETLSYNNDFKKVFVPYNSNTEEKLSSGFFPTGISTHNGRNNGVESIEAVPNDISLGTVIFNKYQEGKLFGLLKESVSIESLNFQNATNPEYYDIINSSEFPNNGNYYYSVIDDGVSPGLKFSTDRTSIDYKLNSALLCKGETKNIEYVRKSKYVFITGIHSSVNYLPMLYGRIDSNYARFNVLCSDIKYVFNTTFSLRSALYP